MQDQNPDSYALTRTQKGWLALYWASEIVSTLMLAGGFVATTMWLWPQMSSGVAPQDFVVNDPWAWTAGALFVGFGAVDVLVHRRAAKRRPVTSRMLRRMQQIAVARKQEALGDDLEALIIIRGLIPQIAGRMWRTQLVLRCNDPDHSPVVVTIPALATVDGEERRFALVRRKTPGWLLDAEPGYRFHARVDLVTLQDRKGWGYVMDFERGRATQDVRSS